MDVLFTKLMTKVQCLTWTEIGSGTNFRCTSSTILFELTFYKTNRRKCEVLVLISGELLPIVSLLCIFKSDFTMWSCMEIRFLGRVSVKLQYRSQTVGAVEPVI